MKSNVELKREKENVIASFQDSVEGQISVSQPITALLLPAEKIVIVKEKIKTEKKVAYKKPTDVFVEFLKKEKINKDGVKLSKENLITMYGADAEPEKIAKTFKRNHFIENAYLDGDGIKIEVKGSYHRTTEHELHALKQLFTLYKNRNKSFDGKFDNEKIVEAINVLAIRHYNANFHGTWTELYNKMNELGNIDIRAIFEEKNTNKKYKSRMDFVLSNYRNLLLDALIEVVLKEE